MTQYLITTFTDSSGMQHKHVAKLKDNQTATVINAESKEKAMKIYEGQTMIKHILKLLFTLATYELGKYVTNVVIDYYKYKQDEVDQAPQDFNEYDHTHLNDEVSE